MTKYAIMREPDFGKKEIAYLIFKGETEPHIFSDKKIAEEWAKNVGGIVINAKLLEKDKK